MSRISRGVVSGLGLKRATRIARPRVSLLLVILLRGMIIVPALRDISCNNRRIGSMFQTLQVAPNGKGVGHGVLQR